MTCWLWRFPWPIGFCWMSNRRPHFVIAAVFTCLISGVVPLAVYTSWVIFTGEVITAVLICLPQCSQAFGLLQLRVLCPVFHQLLQCHTIGFHIYFSTRIIIIKYNHIHQHWNTCTLLHGRIFGKFARIQSPEAWLATELAETKWIPHTKITVHLFVVSVHENSKKHWVVNDWEHTKALGWWYIAFFGFRICCRTVSGPIIFRV